LDKSEEIYDFKKFAALAFEIFLEFRICLLEFTCFYLRPLRLCVINKQNYTIIGGKDTEISGKN